MVRQPGVGRLVGKLAVITGAGNQLTNNFVDTKLVGEQVRAIGVDTTYGVAAAVFDIRFTCVCVRVHTGT